MEITPEPERGAWGFDGAVETTPVGTEGRINRVSATAHLVVRTKRQVAQSNGEFYYLNYKTRGECLIRQSGEAVLLSPGDVGLFASNRPFALDHRRKPVLGVTSFMLPLAALRERLPGGGADKPLLISRNPAFGALIREAAACLSRDMESLTVEQAGKIYDMLLDLVAMAITGGPKVRADGVGSRRAALLLSAKALIRERHARAGLSPASIAGALGVSVRYLHKLFEAETQSFGEYLIDQRLQSAASDLCSPALAATPLSTIALRHGFCDAAHFHRAFKARYGVAARAWREANAG